VRAPPLEFPARRAVDGGDSARGDTRLGGGDEAVDVVAGADVGVPAAARAEVAVGEDPGRRTGSPARGRAVERELPALVPADEEVDDAIEPGLAWKSGSTPGLTISTLTDHGLKPACVHAFRGSGTASAQLPQLSVISFELADAASVSNHFRLPSIPAQPGVTGEPVQWMTPSRIGAPLREL
jgi:hypothetical protein